MICPTCYYPLDDPSYFCTACGRSTSQPVKLSRNVAWSTRAGWPILIAVVALVGLYALSEIRRDFSGPCGRSNSAVELGTSGGSVSLTRLQYRMVAERQGYKVTDSNDNLILTNGTRGYLLVSFQKNWIGATATGRAFDGQQDLTCERAVDLRILGNAVEKEY